MPRVKRLIPNHDNNHCFQACFAMVCEAFTNKPVPMEQAEALTNYIDKRPTWAYQGILSWAENGLYVKYIEQFSHHDFVADPAKTIRDHVQNEEIAEWIVSVSDLEKEVSLVRACMNHPNISFDVRQPSVEDIRSYIEDECLVVVNVNYYGLLGQDKYVGHFVVIEDVHDESITLQNPGAPPISSQIVSKEVFLRAWYSPNEKLANMIVVSDRKI